MTDALLRAALLEAVRLDYGEILAAGPEALPEPAFSAGYLRRRARLLKAPFAHARPRWQRFLRAAAMILLALGLTFALLWANPTTQAWIQRYLRIHRDDVGMDEYTFHGDDSILDLSKIRPTYIPEGYVETEVLEDDDGRSITYENENGDWITFTISPMTQGSAFLLDTDHSTLSDVSVNGISGQLYTAISPEWPSALLLLDESNGLFYYFDTTEPPEELLKMAGSLMGLE